MVAGRLSTPQVYLQNFRLLIGWPHRESQETPLVVVLLGTVNEVGVATTANIEVDTWGVPTYAATVYRHWP